MFVKHINTCFLVFALSILTLLGAGEVFASTNGANISQFDQFSSTSYVLMDYDSGDVLVQFNDKDQVPVASICKLMTSLIVLERVDKGKISLDDMVMVSQHSASVEGSQAFLDEGSEYSVSELLKSVIVASANDSAIALAEFVAGSENAFVELMNNRATELGMSDTVYTNATGLTTKGQYSTAYDTCLILREVNKYSLYGEFAKIWMDTLTHPSGRVTELVNTNRLIKYYPQCVDGKTGYTDEAGYCLSSVAEKDGLRLIAVTLNCRDAGSRFYESMKLYDYGFANYARVVLLDKDDTIIEVNTNYAKNDSARLGITKNLSIVSKIDNKEDIQLKYCIPKIIEAPMSSGTIVGKIDAMIGEEVVASVDVVLLQDIEKHSFLDIIDKIADRWAI